MSSISAGTTSTTTLVHSGDTTGSLVFKTNDTGSGGTTAMTIDTSQNVGIGTTSPTATGGYDKAIDLVGGSNGAGLYIRGSTSPSTVYASIQYDNYSNRTNINAVGTNNFLRFVTVDTERMRIDSSGNLLVGTTSTPTGATGSVVANNASYIGSKVVTWSKVAQSNVITATVTFQTTSSWWSNYIKFTVSCVQSNSANNFAASYLYQIATLDGSGGSVRNVLAQGDNAQFTVTVTGNSGTGSQIWTVSVTGPATANRTIVTLEAGSTVAVQSTS